MFKEHTESTLRLIEDQQNITHNTRNNNEENDLITGEQTLEIRENDKID